MRKQTQRGAAQSWLSDVISRAEHGDACLPWPFNRAHNGYGQTGNYYKKQYAHRLVCIAFHGQPPFEKAEAAHSCNNRACCNPRHLRWATHAENQLDRRKNGTSPAGEGSGNAKLTNANVIKARRLYTKGGYTHKDLAKMFGVSPAAIGLAIQGRTWAHIQEGLTHA